MNAPNSITDANPLFDLGRIVATPDALHLLEKHHLRADEFLSRHAKGDWGNGLCPMDRHANDNALQHGGRLLSSYLLGNDRLWIISEASRESTCLLLPENY